MVSQKKNARGRTDPSVNRLRWAILSFVALIVAAVAVAGVYYTLSDSDEEHDHIALSEAEESQYEELNSPLEDPEGVITVREFFSYACIHCYNLERLLPGWKAGLGADVEFIVVPMAGGGTWTSLAQAYHAMRDLGLPEKLHDELFSSIHDKRMNLSSLNAIGEWIHGRGTSKAQFIATSRSATVKKLIDADLELAKRFRVRSTPTLIVAGKYLVKPLFGPRETLSMAKRLIAKARAERDAESDSPPAASGEEAGADSQ